MGSDRDDVAHDVDDTTMRSGSGPDGGEEEGEAGDELGGSNSW